MNTELLSSNQRTSTRPRYWFLRAQPIAINACEVSSLFFLAVLLLGVLPKAGAALLFYEGFRYPHGEELGETALTSPPWENDKAQFSIGEGSLDYRGMQLSVGNRLNVVGTSESLDSVRTAKNVWSAQSEGALYVSFLLRVESAKWVATTNDGTSILTLGKASNHTYSLGINLLNNGALRLGVLKYPSGSMPVASRFFSSGLGADISATGDVTYLIVAKYEWVDGRTNDVVSLWVNPKNLSAENPADNVSTCIGDDGNERIERLTLSRGPHVVIDEIRIGQTWADVTPTNAPRTVASEK